MEDGLNTMFLKGQFILILCTLGVCVNILGNVPLKSNRKLINGYTLNTSFVGGLHECVDNCVFRTNCLSSSYNLKTRICEMYFKNSTEVGLAEIIVENFTILVDSSSWPKFRTGKCSDKPCTEQTTCVPERGSYRCNDDIHASFPPKTVNGCSPFILPEHGMYVDEDSVKISPPTLTVYPVGSSVRVRCEPPLLTSYVNTKQYIVINCRDNLEWSKSYSCYTVEEICTYQVLENFYTSNMTVNVTSSMFPWFPVNGFLNSSEAWTSAVNNDEQFISVDFTTKLWTGGIVTRGDSNSNWVKSYKLSYSKMCNIYHFITDTNNQEKVFLGNTDAGNSVTNYFEIPIHVRCLRLHPKDYQGKINLRLDVLACKNYGIIGKK